MEETHLMIAIASLTGAIVVLWRVDRARIVKDLDVARAEISEWRSRWSDEVKQRAQDAEKFLRALEKKRGGSSAPPPTYRP
jgi:hypothetical protein